MKTTLALVQRNDSKTETNINSDELLNECRKRMETDPNYKKSDYDVDYIRITVLKLPPNRKAEPEATNKEVGPTEATEIGENYDELSFSDDQSQFKMDAPFNFSFGEENMNEFDFGYL